MAYRAGEKALDERGFRSFLKEGKRVPRNLPEDTIRRNIEFAERFEGFGGREKRRGGVKDASSAKVDAFMKHLAKTKENTVENLLGLLRYARFIDDRELELKLLVTLDGVDVLGKLLDAARQKLGDPAYYEMFSGYRPPPLGTSQKNMPGFTTEFMERLERGTDRKCSREVLLTGVHAGPPEAYADEKDMLQESRDIDEYLSKRRQKLIDLLEGHRRDGTLFFTQEIDELCMDFVRGNPEVAGGIRKGNHIYQTKIPYMMKEYLRETDRTMRRYYYCHCPLAREAILSGEEIPRDFCYCSAGYEKKPYEVAFGSPVKTVVLKSVLWGDDTCRFRMEIPEKHRAGRQKARKPVARRRKSRGK